MTVQSRKVLFRIVITLALLAAVLLLALWIKPPDILRVGANYSAKIICSNVFLAGRDPEVVLHSDVQAPGIALLRSQVATNNALDRIHPWPAALAMPLVPITRPPGSRPHAA